MIVWGSIAPYAQGVFSTQLAAEPGQSPMPSGVSQVPEDCKGIAPTPGSKNDVTQKQLNEGQGLINPGPNSFDPGGTVHFLVLYNPTAKSASFDIRDCVVVFQPGNPHIADVLALISPGSFGQIVPTPGSTPAVKGFDAVLDLGADDKLRPELGQPRIHALARAFRRGDGAARLADVFVFLVHRRLMDRRCPGGP